jgi:hypothetical protein
MQAVKTTVTKTLKVISQQTNKPAMFMAVLFILGSMCCMIKKIGFRAGPYAGYNYGTSKHSPNTYLANPKEVKGATNDYNAGANLDLVYYPSPKVGIAATLVNLAYSHNKSTDNSSPNTNEVENFAFNFINSGLTLNVFFVLGSK